MPAQANLLLEEVKRLTRGNVQLVTHQVYACDKFGNRMLYLQACIHFEKIKMLIGIEYEFERPCIHVPGGPGNTHTGRSHLFPYRGSERTRGTCFDNFLMAALDRARSL